MIRKIVYDFLYLGDKILELVIFWFFVLALSIGVYALWDNQQIYQHADASLYGEYIPTEKTKTGFEELQERNPDVRGWIQIDNTNISYPVVQGKDNYKYINKDAVGKDSLSGSIFMDYRNASDFSDPNIIIYGHHMEKNKMFGELENFKKKKYFSNHERGAIYYEGSWHQIEIFAFLQADAYDNFIYDINFGSQKTDTKCLNRIKKKSIYFRKLRWKKEEHFITLSTCMSDCTNGRYVLIGRIAQEESD